MSAPPSGELLLARKLTSLAREDAAAGEKAIAAALSAAHVLTMSHRVVRDRLARDQPVRHSA